jgi:SAM-dependent methyltransferase
MLQSASCPICAQAMRADLIADVYRCEACGFFCSSLPVRINANNDSINERQRLKALESVRRRNFAAMLDWLADRGFPSAGEEILEVGCGHGWFLDEARRRGLSTSGIEPDAAIAGIARRAGHKVIEGYFPAALDPSARFQAIVFNDVFEHLPDIQEVMAGVGRHTRKGGWVVVNLPVSDGLLFRTSRVLARLGLAGPYRRLWQAGLPSPHLSYFSTANIEALFARHGFKSLGSAALRAIDVKGLFKRIRYDRQIGLLRASFYYAGAVMLAPVLPLTPADIRFFVFRKRA